MAKEVKLAGFKYTKLAAERKESTEALKITPGINIKSIDKHESETSKQNFLKVEFKFGISYGSHGNVELEGFLVLAVDSKTQKDALDSWKNKKLDNDINILILNIIMQKASLKALEMEEEMSLPPHVQIPRLQLGKK